MISQYVLHTGGEQSWSKYDMNTIEFSLTIFKASINSKWSNNCTAERQEAKQDFYVTLQSNRQKEVSLQGQHMHH